MRMKTLRNHAMAIVDLCKLIANTFALPLVARLNVVELDVVVMTTG